MRNFRLTHIAVNFLLIASIAFQGVVACAVDTRCGSIRSGTRGFSCQGCGGCDVQQMNDRCGCCTRLASAKAAAGGCCDHSEEPSNTTEPSVLDSGVKLATVGKIGFRSACQCGQQPNPISDSTPTGPGNELRDILTGDPSGLEEASCDDSDLLAAARYDAGTPLQARFSQQVLCIWRL